MKPDKDLLYKYAELAVKVGVNLQKGQLLEISTPVECEEFALILAEVAYMNGAGRVLIDRRSDNENRLAYTYSSAEELEKVPAWFVEKKNYLVTEGACRIAIDADDPEALKGLDEAKIARRSSAYNKALKIYSDAIMGNAIRWCVIAYPSYNWAKLMFPESDDPEAELFEAIKHTVRLDSDDPVAAWNDHIETLNRHAKIMNDYDFSYLRYETSAGTNLKVGLAKDAVWLPAQEKAKDGVPFIANMPTEEVFTAPDNTRIDGVVKNALPLSYNGTIIDGFSVTFKDGKVIEFSAEQGYETLKALINTDEGTKSLGEMALVGKNSPIAKSKLLFYNTLFDENASCHFAFGQAYPTTIKGGGDMTAEELAAHNANDSVEHVDFMVGTEDLKITGVTKDGKEVVVFIDGEWAF